MTGKVPFPPLSRMGLPELEQMENMSMDGITYVDTFFINHLRQTESLHFHELVHVVQWERLGVDNFLLAYGVGLMQSGDLYQTFEDVYLNSPLEQMAYSLQAGFESVGINNQICLEGGKLGHLAAVKVFQASHPSGEMENGICPFYGF